MKISDFNEATVQLFALRGIINMHMRADKAGVACKLNGERAVLDMGVWQHDNMSSDSPIDTKGCGTAACLGGSACMHPYFKKQGLNECNYKEFFNFPEVEGLFFDRYRGEDGEYKRMYPTHGFRVKAPDVRRAIDKLIVQYGGRAALTFAKELEKQGDELNLGVE